MNSMAASVLARDWWKQYSTGGVGEQNLPTPPSPSVCTAEERGNGYYKQPFTHKHIRRVNTIPDGDSDEFGRFLLTMMTSPGWMLISS